jgi:hypothetical protein
MLPVPNRTEPANLSGEHRATDSSWPVRADRGWWTMLSAKKEQGGRHLGRTVRETFTCEGLLLLVLVLCRPPGDNERKRLVPVDGGEAEAEVKDRAEQGPARVIWAACMRGCGN